MANIIIPPGWRIKENAVTSEAAYSNRRAFLRRLGLGTIGLLSVSALACAGDPSRYAMSVGAGSMQAQKPGAPAPDGPLDTIPANAPRAGFPALRNDAFDVPERDTSTRLISSSYNNFYEFDGSSKKVWHLTGDYEPFPWTLKTSGLVEEEQTWDLDDLFKMMDLEERLYRFRCVEAWSITVPWTGFPLAKLIEKCKPRTKATHVQFICVDRPEQMPGIANQPWYTWPYYEALRLDEAMNELAFVATGMYGAPLPKQNGSPLRLAFPWKYGYKGPKAITEIRFMDRQPGTFWNDLQPKEYGFLSNVNPNIPHPRWSQASERFLPDVDTERRVPTMIFNGYDEWVGDLYPDAPREPGPPIIR